MEIEVWGIGAPQGGDFVLSCAFSFIAQPPSVLYL